jgi:hypothetical protein
MVRRPFLTGVPHGLELLKGRRYVLRGADGLSRFQRVKSVSY